MSNIGGSPDHNTAFLAAATRKCTGIPGTGFNPFCESASSGCPPIRGVRRFWLTPSPRLRRQLHPHGRPRQPDLCGNHHQEEGRVPVLRRVHVVCSDKDGTVS